MTVKDLIEHFDSPRTSSAPDNDHDTSIELDLARDTQRISRLVSWPSSNRARFLKHPARLDTGDNSEPSVSRLQPIIDTPQIDIADSLNLEENIKKPRLLAGLPSHPNPLSALHSCSPVECEDNRPLLPRIGENNTEPTVEQHNHQSHELKHHPIPSTIVFARDAPPLYLPELDSYIISLPPPDFPDTPGGVFPPMDKLKDSGKSIKDLESNSTIPPFWRNRRTILASITNAVLGLMGSSALASFYSLQGLINTVQIFALLLSTIVPVGGQNIGDKWKKLFLGTIPNILALNFASTLVQSLVFLLIFMAIAAGLLYYFYRSISSCYSSRIIEGFQGSSESRSQWGLVIVTFLLTVIYLPLSTMAVHVLVWSEDLWVVPNPYINATSYPPAVLPLGPTNEYRDPLDFCWTTTMKRNQVNYAPVVVLLAIIVFCFLTMWFPLALHRVIKICVPRVDRFTELGRARNDMEMDGEYHRILSRDSSPFSFLYGGFRRGWGTYESIYLGAKLSTLFIVAVVDSNNCLFRSLSRSLLPVIRQVLLLLCALSFFLAQCIFAPFLDPVNNASEWTSRLNYLTTSIVALAVAFDIPAESIFNTYVLYTIYITTYGLSFYFTVVNIGPTQRAIKRFTRRIDFSIDVFSPRLDISYSSPHVRRRIWQESVTTMLLTNPECAIPNEQTMAYAQANDLEYPPYLLNFSGTPGERHVENLKILREVGNLTYTKAAGLTCGPDFLRYRRLEEEIQRRFVGPDCYWKDPTLPTTLGCTRYFGNAWWIPFPPTLVLRYDDGPLVILNEISDLETYINQNSSEDIRNRRFVRLSLRALEGQVVSWPYKHISTTGTHSGLFRNSGYKTRESTQYHSCVLRIKRRGHLVWDGLQLGSGFDVTLQYSKRITIPGEMFGLNDDYDLTAPLARFLDLNQPLVTQRLPRIEEAFDNYRDYYRKVGRWKNRVLTYQFLSRVYDHPQDPVTLTTSVLESEKDPRVRHIMTTCETALRSTYHRWVFVSQSEGRTWWYLFWDDLWRRNYNTTPGMTRHATDFDPHFPTSIAYCPLARAALESFLVKRGLFSRTGGWSTLFTPGFLNKLYLRLNDAVFRSSSKAILFHIGIESTERGMMEVDLETRVAQGSVLGTGAGTNHDDSWIQTRPNYRWEGIMNDTPSKGKIRRNWTSKLGAWLGLTPTWRSGAPSNGLSLDVRLKNGRFVLLNQDNGSVSVNDEYK